MPNLIESVICIVSPTKNGPSTEHKFPNIEYKLKAAIWFCTFISCTKKLLLESEQLSLDEELKKEREKNKDSGNTGDAVEGIKAFLEKREPKFE